MPVITISRGTYYGAQAVAKHVASQLGIPHVDRDIVLRAAAALGADPATIQAALDESPSAFDRYTRSRTVYLSYVRAALCQRAAEGSFVYEGNEGHLLLDGIPTLLRVRVEAPEARRVQAVMEARGCSAAEALEHVRRATRVRRKWTSALYGVKHCDPLRYDVTLNLENLGVEEAADVVRTIAAAPRYRWDATRRQQAADVALAARVRAELARTWQLFCADLEISARAGVVTVEGHARVPEDRDAIQRTIEGLDDVDALRMQVRIPSDALRV